MRFPFWILLLCILAFSGCKGGENNNGKTIADLTRFFKERSISIGGSTEKIAALIGASSGAMVEIDGDGIEIYKFDLDIPVQKALLEKYEREGLDLGLTKRHVLRNGSFLILEEPSHQKWSEVKTAFLAFD